MSFPGSVHRAPAAGSPEPDQPQFSRRHDGQAARRLRAEHRVHAGAARRAAAPDGDGRRGLRRVSAVARSGRRRDATVRQVEGKFCASFFCSTDEANNQIASFYTGAMADAGQLSFRTLRTAGSRSSRRTTRRHGPVRRGMPHARHPRSSSIRGSSARGCRGRTARRRRRRHGRHLQ